MATIPGVGSQIADGQLRITQTVSGPKLTILGTTTNASIPVLEPIGVRDIQLGVAALEHSAGNPSELSIAVEEAITAGAQNIEVINISASSGEAAAFTANARWDGLLGAYAILRAHDVSVVHPVGAYLDETGLTGTDSGGATRDNFGKQLADFCHRATTVDANSAVGVIGVKSILKVANDESWTGAPTTVSGELFESVTTAQVTEWLLHLQGSALGEDHSAEELVTGGYTAGSTEATPGVISSSYDFWARGEDETIATDQFGTKVDGGGYIAVVAGLCKAAGGALNKLKVKYGNSSAATYNTNGAAHYAGFLTVRDAHVGTTNKIVPGLLPAREFTRAQATIVLDQRMVTFMTRPRGYVVLSGITAAYNASDFTRSDFVNQTTRDIVNAAVDGVRLAVDPFIGEALNAVNQNAMESSIDVALRKLLSRGALRRYAFELESTPDMQILGQMNVKLVLVPAFELKSVTIFVALSRQ